MMKENLWEIYVIGEVFVCWCSELLSKKIRELSPGFF